MNEQPDHERTRLSEQAEEIMSEGRKLPGIQELLDIQQYWSQLNEMDTDQRELQSEPYLISESSQSWPLYW